MAMSRVLAAAVALVVLSAPARPELRTAEEIDACTLENFPKETSVQTISMNARDRIGAVTQSKATMYWKRFDEGLSRVMMRFFKPPDLRGAGLLMIENEGRDDMFIYLPELGRVKRITSRMTSASMFGTDFSYEEFQRLQELARSSSPRRLEDAVVDQRPAYVLEIQPGPEEESAYERIKTFVDKETCIVLKTEYYERGDQPRKVLTAEASRITREGDIWVARELLMRDFRDETSTTMIVEEIEVEKPISRKIFSENELVARGR